MKRTLRERDKETDTERETEPERERERENLPSYVEQHIYVVVFLGQFFHLVLLSHVHHLGSDTFS